MRFSCHKFVSLLLAFVLLFSLFVSKALAFENPHYFYDWNRSKSRSVLGYFIFAQEDTQDDFKSLDSFSHTPKFLDNLIPGDTSYFLKTAEENLSRAFTLNAQQKDIKRMQITAERVEEIKKLAEKVDEENLKKAVARYQKTSGDLADKLQDNFDKDDEKLASLEKENAKQILVLGDVLTSSSDIASDSLEKAISASEQVSDSISDEKENPSVPQVISDRLQALKAQGLLTEEEVTDIISVGTRSELREKLKDYVNKNLFPQADFVKLNEGTKEYYPDKYLEVIELKKFEELKELESEKPDEETLAKIQEFAKNYEPGDIVPPELKKWWVPMVRLEELQNTIRPDLIDESVFKDKPDYTQKFEELVQRIKPTKEDIAYIDSLIERNSKILNDPFYARMKVLADKYGTADTKPPAVLNCGANQHWVNIIFMPQGGYCVPNIEYAFEEGATTCPPGYHKPGPDANCISDRVSSTSAKSKASEDCPSGYLWVTDSFGGFCEPEFSSDSGGTYPSPIFSPAYCSPGQIFKDGNCAEYQPAPSEGCPEGQFWNGEACIKEGGDSGFSYCSPPPNGCSGGRWDGIICNCDYEPTPQPTFAPASEESQTTNTSTSEDSSSTSSNDSGGNTGSSKEPGAPTPPPTCDITSCPEPEQQLIDCKCIFPGD